MKTSKLVLWICGVIAGVAIIAAGIWIVLYGGKGSVTPMDRMEALQYALADAGLQESDVTITQEKLERDDGKQQYEIEFYTSEYMYEYEIDAVTGKVLDVEIKAMYSF